MGIKRELNRGDLKFISLTPTKDGVSDSVYIVDRDSILKIYENASIEEIEAEVNLLNSLKNINVAKVKSDIFRVQDRYALLFERAKGVSPKRIEPWHIVSIGQFLKKFHKISKRLDSKNRNIYSLELLKNMVYKIDRVEFYEMFEKVKGVKLDINGVIHGDIFPDNSKFYNAKLSAVYDFIEHSKGNFLFDLAVVAISWCYQNSKLSKEYLLKLIYVYDKNLKLNRLKPYINYAFLYYASTRYLSKSKDYLEMVKGFKIAYKL